MVNLKNAIKRQFDKSYDTYDTYCSLQNEVCDRSIQLLKKQAADFEVMADFACGTGESTLRLIERIAHRQCYAIDFSDKLLSVAMQKLPSTVYPILSDFENILFEAQTLDLIFCNMGLQWALNLEKTFELFQLYLNQTGYLVFSMPVQGNFPEIKQNFKYPLLAQEEIFKCLEQNRFQVVESCLYQTVRRFESHKDALISLKKVGANVSFQQALKVNLRDVFVEDCVDPRLTYCVGIYVCRKLGIPSLGKTLLSKSSSRGPAR